MLGLAGVATAHAPDFSVGIGGGIGAAEFATARDRIAALEAAGAEVDELRVPGVGESWSAASPPTARSA